MRYYELQHRGQRTNMQREARDGAENNNNKCSYVVSVVVIQYMTYMPLCYCTSVRTT